jgi:radical SAM superfamily enzyme YgiQ (UPF0313 family)
MEDRSLNRWLLVNYSGYTYTPSSLIPDNGLANLGGALIRDGRQVEILDYATVSMMARFTPLSLRRRLLRTWETACAGNGGETPPWKRLWMLAGLQRGEFVRRRAQARVLQEIGRDLVEKVRRDGVDAVGFKLWNGDGISGSVTLATILRRECPDTRLFAGGPHVDLFMETMVEQFEVFDAFVYGEGEETIVRLAEEGGDRTAYGDIPNLLYRCEGRPTRTQQKIVENLDRLPMPAYDPQIYPAMTGDEKLKIMVIDDSRGCRNHCAFCVHPVKSAHNLRVKSISRIMRELESLETRHGIRTFRFAGSCTPYRLLNDFAGELLHRGKDYLYSSFAHVRQSASADFRRLRKSGCRALFFGVESGNQEILDKMQKGTRVEMIRAALNGAREAGIDVIAGLIHPAPGETRETADETAALLRETRPVGVTVLPPVVMPRTKWFDSPEEFGIGLDHDTYDDALFYWKVKFLMPPTFWEKLPYRVDGRKHSQILKASTDFARRVEDEGAMTSVTDESCLMSIRAGMDVSTFRDESRLAFFAGDAERVAKLVTRVNAAV